MVVGFQQESGLEGQLQKGRNEGKEGACHWRAGQFSNLVTQVGKAHFGKCK